MVTTGKKVMMAVIKLEGRSVCSVAVCFQELITGERPKWKGRDGKAEETPFHNQERRRLDQKSERDGQESE